MDHAGDSTTISNSTITANRADSDSNGNGGGGGIFVFENTSGVVTVDNSIVAGNFRSNTRSDVAHSIVANYSLIGVDFGASITRRVGNVIGTSSQPADPRVGPLQLNGGSTQTHALELDSPAVDAGNPAAVAGQLGTPMYDARGSQFGRVLDGDGVNGPRIDIGAYEMAVRANPAAGATQTTESVSAFTFYSELGNPIELVSSARTGVAYQSQITGLDNVSREIERQGGADEQIVPYFRAATVFKQTVDSADCTCDPTEIRRRASETKLLFDAAPNLSSNGGNNNGSDEAFATWVARSTFEIYSNCDVERLASNEEESDFKDLEKSFASVDEFFAELSHW
jgi:hypothetical protein